MKFKIQTKNLNSDKPRWLNDQIIMAKTAEEALYRFLSDQDLKLDARSGYYFDIASHFETTRSNHWVVRAVPVSEKDEEKIRVSAKIV